MQILTLWPLAFQDCYRGEVNQPKFSGGHPTLKGEMQQHFSTFANDQNSQH